MALLIQDPLDLGSLLIGQFQGVGHRLVRDGGGALLLELKLMVPLLLVSGQDGGDLLFLAGLPLRHLLLERLGALPPQPLERAPALTNARLALAMSTAARACASWARATESSRRISVAPWAT